MSKQHILKIHKAPLEALLSGAKTCEVRFNDRGFEVGDTVALREVNPFNDVWTGRPYLIRTISHIQTGYGLPEGLCVLSYAQPAAGEPAKSKHRQEMDELRKERERSMTAPPAAAHGDEAVRKDAERLDFILSKCRKVTVELLPRGCDVYVEEGVFGERIYPAINVNTVWGPGSPEDMAIKREAIDAAMRAQGDGEVQ